MLKWREWPVLRDLIDLRNNLRLEQARRVPVLAVNEVLFPGGIVWFHVPVEIYGPLLEAVAQDGRPIAVCLDRYVNGLPMQDFEPCGVLARVTETRADGDQIAVRLEAAERFRVVERLRSHGILYAKGYASTEPVVPVVPELERSAGIVALMLASEADAGGMPEERLKTDASYVSYRLAERLPLAGGVKLKLLELDDPNARLSIMMQYLKRQRLLDQLPLSSLLD